MNRMPVPIGSRARGAALPAVLLAAMALPAAAQDVIEVASSNNEQGFVRHSGKILDYTGKGLSIELAGQVLRNYPPEQVLRIATDYGRLQREADARFAQGDFRSALALYSQARATEPRAWVRRQITAQMVWCYQALDQWAPAGEEFLVLVRSDPVTIHFDCIPLAWLPAEPDPALEQAARQWLARDDLPVAVLLGASHLLPTGSGPVALARLKSLTTLEDPRVAPLALAQTWRMATVTATPDQLKGWERVVETLPEPLRAGPYCVLGQGWAQRQGWEQAALAWMRLPVLYPRHRRLAMRATLGAGQALETLGRTQQAARLYAELVERYPNTPAEAEARGRLEELQKAAKGT